MFDPMQGIYTGEARTVMRHSSKIPVIHSEIFPEHLLGVRQCILVLRFKIMQLCLK